MHVSGYLFNSLHEMAASYEYIYKTMPAKKRPTRRPADSDAH
jgi:hypothetical protein